MVDLIKELGEPSDFWNYFVSITKIPRCSGNEGGLRKFITYEAESFGFGTKQDKVGNLVVSLPAQKEEKRRVILQSHMDMVCEKNENVKHDFTKDPLNLEIIDLKGEKWLTANGTTLGADNAVGVAFSLLLMKRIHQGENYYGSLGIDLLFTVNEETGLNGAFNIGKDIVKGEYLINLDSEEDDEFTVGCAGGIATFAEIRVDFEKIEYGIPIKLSISGLQGGHSGVDIHLGRGNAIKIMANLLSNINKYVKIYIQSINGGNRTNAIPRECQCILFVLPKDLSQLIKKNDEQIEEIRRRIYPVDPYFIVNLESLIDYDDVRVFPDKIQEKLLVILNEMPNGAISIHPKLTDLVHTSNNLASIKTKKNKILIDTGQRSLEEKSKIEISQKIENLLKQPDLDVKITHIGDYPGWDPDFNSQLVQLSKEVYEEMFSQPPKIKAIHAGLECGILKKHFPEMQMISIGPNIVGPHSPDERLSIKSVDKFWKFLSFLLISLM